CGCNGNDALARAGDDLDYRTCRDCAFVWLQNAAAPEEDIAQEGQNTYYLRQQDRIDAEMAAVRSWVDAVIRRAETPVRSVVELGCTHGVVLRACADRGLRVLGVERCAATASF